MEGPKLALILSLALIVPLSVQAAAAHDQPTAYALGTSAADLVVTSASGFETGSMWWDIPQDGQGDNAFVFADVRIRDVHTGNVAAFYSFHNPDHNDGSIFGGAGSALVSGQFCQTDRLEIPEEATQLRIVLNSFETMDDLNCLPGVATAGTVDVSWANPPN